MSFQQGLSGLSVMSKALDVTGNNIANASTVGFKASRIQFADVYASTVGNNQVGAGASVAAIGQQFGQGNIASSNNPLDLAINGQGFFRLDNNGLISWTRNGQFSLDKDGYIVNADGLKLTGRRLDDPTAPVPTEIFINTADLQARATEGVRIGLNLDARKTPPTGAFDPDDAATYNDSTALTTYDSLGNPHLLTLYFVKTATPNEWAMYTRLGAGAPSGPTTVEFDGGTGAMVNPSAPVNLTFAVTTGATTPFDFTLNLAGTTQYGSSFGVTNLAQDGYTSGRLAGLSVASDGTIQGRYSNGQTQNLAQVMIGYFKNPNALSSLGGNQWAETAESGQPLVGVPGTGLLGMLSTAAVEESNVDITTELVNMIIQQRMYQANAQTIKTQDSILQTLVNMR